MLGSRQLLCLHRKLGLHLRRFGFQGGPVGDHRLAVSRSQFDAVFQLCKVTTQPIGRCLDVTHLGL